MPSVGWARLSTPSGRTCGPAAGCCWARATGRATPSQKALDALGAEPGELPDIAGLVAEAQRHGFEPGYGHLSTAAEWDHYEWSWTGSLTGWALSEEAGLDRAAALELAREHRGSSSTATAVSWASPPWSCTTPPASDPANADGGTPRRRCAAVGAVGGRRAGDQISGAGRRS